MLTKDGMKIFSFRHTCYIKNKLLTKRKLHEIFSVIIKEKSFIYKSFASSGYAIRVNIFKSNFKISFIFGIGFVFVNIKNSE